MFSVLLSGGGTIRLSLFISLLLISVAVLIDVQTNIRGDICILSCTTNNRQNIIVDFGNINPEHMDNSRGEVARTISISYLYKSGSPWIGVTGNTMGGGQNNILAMSITHLDVALYQGEGMSTPLTLGNGLGSGYKVTVGLGTACPAFTLTSMSFRNGSGILGGGDLRTMTSMSMVYN